VTKTGKIIDVLLSAILEHDEQGRPLRSVAVIEDITLRRRVERELAKEHELLRVTLQSIGDAVITTDGCGHISWLNPAAERMTGWLSEEA
ncbi:PAS domain S-box protein, partial [Acinetobacter baumannii]